MVAGGRRNHPACLLLWSERRELRQDAARLERAGALQELGLEVDVGPERPAGERRSAMEAAGDDACRAIDVLAADAPGLHGGRW